MFRGDFDVEKSATLRRECVLLDLKILICDMKIKDNRGKIPQQTVGRY